MAIDKQHISHLADQLKSGKMKRGALKEMIAKAEKSGDHRFVKNANEAIKQHEVHIVQQEKALKGGASAKPEGKGARLKAFAEQGNAPSGATRGRNLNIAQQNAMNLTSKAYKSNTAEAHKAAASAHELVSKAADNEGYSRASTHHLGRAGEHHGKVAELAGNKDQAQHHATKAKQLTTEANRRQKLSDQIAEERFQRGHGGGGMGDAGIGKAGPASPAPFPGGLEAARAKLAKRGAAMQAGVKQQQASKLSTNDPKHHELMAEHHALLGNKEQASQHANKAAKLAAFAKSGKPADLGIGKAGPASPAHGRLEAARAKLGKASKSESEWLGKMRGVISAKRDVRAVERKKGPTAPIQTSARGAKYYTNKSGEKVYVK